MAVPDPLFTAGCMQPSNELPNSICIVRLSAIGDVCHVVAVVQAIQKYYPNAAITWVIGRVEHALLGDLPGIEFIVFDKAKGLRAYYDVKKQLGTRPAFDVLLQMQTSMRANLLGGLLNAKRKIGFPVGLGKELHNLVVREHPSASDAFHVLDIFKEFAYAIGVPAFDATWSIPISSRDQLAASALVHGEPGYALLAPSASHSERIWMPERYAAVADYCHAKGLKVAVTGSAAPREMDLASLICDLADSTLINVAGQTSLKELLALCRHARLVIGPDSGTLHMAITQRTPVVGLYAHSNPRRTGPYKGLQSVADAYTNILTSRGQQDRSEQWGYRLKGEALMREIQLETVTSLIDQALNQTYEARPFS